MASRSTLRARVFATIVGCMGMTPWAWSQDLAPGERTAVFVSDLHMGVGRDPKDPQRWHPTEDFRWHAEFASFLDAVNRAEHGRVDLVLVGDVLELWQTPAGEASCQNGSNAGCSEAEAKQRVGRVLEQHAAVFEALGKFVSRDTENRITIVPGNHDVAFAFESVRKMVLDAIGAPAERASVAIDGYWLSADGHVLAEHGQQVGRDPNAFHGWPHAPFVEKGGTRYLHQTWGEHFVQRLFNQYEIDYPVIDNLASESLGAKYAMKHLGYNASVQEAGKFARFLVFQQSWLQAKQFVGEQGSQTHDWDFTKIDQSTNSKRWEFIAASLGADDPLAGQLRAMSDELPPIEVLDKEQLRAACDRRLALREQLGTAAAEPCPQKGMAGSVGERVSTMIFSGTQAKAYRERLTDLKEQVGARSAFTTYVYGHTHHEHRACTPFAKDDGWKPIVINDGAWQRTASEEVFCTLIEGKEPSEALKDLQPEDLPACYPFVRIRASKAPELRYWVQPKGAADGAVHTTCTDAKVSHGCRTRPSDACPAHPDQSRS